MLPNGTGHFNSEKWRTRAKAILADHYFAGVTSALAKFACTLTVDHPPLPPKGAIKCGGQAIKEAGAIDALTLAE
jgi:hypothetical protein